ncbi:unnamed protein product [Acidithrix sp. C25]|nr:unnamed protein product [Acidithrix sp. C25]
MIANTHSQRVKAITFEINRSRSIEVVVPPPIPIIFHLSNYQ